MLHILFIALQHFLLGIGTFNDQEVTYIRMWVNQYQRVLNGDMEDMPFPCILVEFVDPLEWQQLGNGVQTIDPLRIRLHILYQELDAGDGSMEQNLDIFAFTQAIYEALQDWMPTTITIPTGEKFAGTYTVPLGAMVRKTEIQDNEHTDLYHFISEYETNWIEPSLVAPVGGSNSGTITYDFAEIEPWNDTTPYVVDNVVSFTDGNIYTCIANNTNETPPNTAYWKQIGSIPS